MRIILPMVFLLLSSCYARLNHERPSPRMTTKPCGLSVMNILEIPSGTVDFSVDRKRPHNSDIYINSNFFDSNGPIGELVVRGKKLSSRSRGGGYFFVKSGRPSVSDRAPTKGVEYSTQSILIAINDGKVNSALTRQPHAIEPTYRSLIGIDKNKTLYFLASGRGCFVSISKIISYAKDLKLQEAILPDAGSSVDYKLSDGERVAAMKAIPGSIKYAMDIEEPKSYIVGKILD